jgi:hypothetical protein
MASALKFTFLSNGFGLRSHTVDATGVKSIYLYFFYKFSGGTAVTAEGSII